MQISVTYGDSELAKVLETIIDHPNKAEFVKLLTPMICGSSSAAQYFFKALIGSKLPDVYTPGTVCKMPVRCLSSDFNREKVREKYADSNDMVLVTIKEFRGFHEWTDYIVESLNIVDNTGRTKMTQSYVKTHDLELVEEF